LTVYADCIPSEKKQADELAFQGRLSLLGSFATQSQFESRFAGRLDRMPQGLALRVFRQGIQPLWEDAQNSGDGAGKWILQGGCKLVMARAFRSILQKMAADQLIGINGVVSVCKRGQHVLMLWTRAPTPIEATVADPFGVRLLAADLSTEVGTAVSAGFKPHGNTGIKKKKSRSSEHHAAKQCDSNSDYELSPELQPVLCQLQVAPLGLNKAEQSAPRARAWSMIVDGTQEVTRTRSMSWAQKAMMVQAQ